MDRKIKKKRDKEVHKPMTIQEAKQELKEYRDNIAYIRGKKEDLEEMRTYLEKTTTRLSKTRTSNNSMGSDKIIDGISRMDAIEKEYDKKLQELLLKKFMVDDKIDKLDEPYRTLLFYRYTRRKSWQEVAKEIDYGVDNTYKLHGKALYYYSLL